MKKERIIAEIQSLEQARRVEEAVKAGYPEAVVGNLLNWMAVEEDLAASYERLADSLVDKEAKAAAGRLGIESRDTVEQIEKLLSTFEKLDSERKERLKLIDGLKDRR
jgi:type II secretory pathway component PulK